VVGEHHVVVFTYHGFGGYPVLDSLAVATLIGVGVGPWWWRRRRPTPS